MFWSGLSISGHCPCKFGHRHTVPGAGKGLFLIQFVGCRQPLLWTYFRLARDPGITDKVTSGPHLTVRRFFRPGGIELAAEDHARARGRHNEFLWHLLLDCHHGAEASAVHGNQVVRVDLLQGLHSLGYNFIRIRGQVPPANDGLCERPHPSRPIRST